MQQQTFQEFVSTYIIQQKKQENRKLDRQTTRQLFSQEDFQQNSLQIQQNLSYQNSKTALSDSLPQLKFKTLTSDSINTNNGLNSFRVKRWKTNLSKDNKPFCLIRNQELFNDCIKKISRYNSNSQQQLLPLKQLPTKEKMIQAYLIELSQKRKDIPKPQGLDDILNTEAENIYIDITKKDQLLCVKFPHKNYPGLKNIYKILLSSAYEQQVFMDLQRLRSIHLGMSISHQHFFKFKYHFLNKYIDLNIPTDKMFHCCERIENMRPYVLNEILEYQIYGEEDGIKLITQQMYKKILSDVTLAPYFESIDVQTQEIKFARLFFQLIYHLDSPNYSIDVLRQRHVKYGLTNVQFTNFKYYLSLTLQNTGIPWKNIRQLLRRMDIYKYAIINKNDLQYYVNKVGFPQFIDSFMQSCQQDALLSELISKRGKSRFRAHCCNIFHYFFRYNIKAITREDIHTIHKNKQIVTEKVFEKLRIKAITAVKELTDDALVIDDFIEDWDEIKSIVLGEQREQHIIDIGEEILIQKLLYQLEYEFEQRHLNQIFDTEEAHMSNSIICKLNLLLYGVRFFKKRDLQIIHKRFRITSNQYYDFSLSFKAALQNFPQLHYVHSLIQEYEPYIVND